MKDTPTARMTLAEFVATRTVCADLGQAPYATPDMAGQSGWLYLDSLYIINSPAGLWTMLDRDAIVGNQSDLEAQLYLWACREGYCDEVLP